MREHDIKRALDRAKEIEFEIIVDYTYLMELAARANTALYNVHGKTYTVGNIANTIYVASGSSVDWVKGELRVPYTFVMELRHKRNMGMLVPPSEIIPCGEEVWAFHKVVARQVIKDNEEIISMSW